MPIRRDIPVTGNLLCAKDVELSYGPTTALAGASLGIRPGEIVAVVGKSGSGKSSLLYCLSGIVRPQHGQVLFGEVPLHRASDEELSAIRLTRFGFVFQFGELVPELTIEENVSLPLDLVGTGAAEVSDRVRSLLETLGIWDLRDRRPSQVSGGQAQRAAVARALVHEPTVVFADEPTGSLDSGNSAAVLSEFVRLAKDAASAVILVTHESAVADVADRTVELIDGRTCDEQ